MDAHSESPVRTLAQQSLVVVLVGVVIIRFLTPILRVTNKCTSFVHGRYHLEAKAPESDCGSDASYASSLPDPPTPPSKHVASLEENAKSLITELLDRIDWRPLRLPENAEVRRLLQAEVDSWEVDISPELKERLVAGSCFLTQRCYPFGTFEQLRYTAFWTAYFVYAEDHCAKNLDHISRFSHRLLTRQKQDDPVLERFVRHLEKMYDLYPAISCNLVSSATCDFVSSVYLEYTLPKDVGKDPLAPSFPLYLRLKTAAAIPFAYFMFPKTVTENVGKFIKAIPDIELFITYINDIVSFYKEEITGDTYNYVHMQAATRKMDPLDVIRELIDRTDEIVHRLSNIYKVDPEIHKIITGFLHGYTEFHILSPRYRLHELGFS